MAVLTQPQNSPGTTIAVARHATPQGRLRAEWTAAGLYRIGWDAAEAENKGDEYSLRSAEVRNRLHSFHAAMDAYLAGKFDALSRIVIDPGNWTPFLANVYRNCRVIPAGQTLTYGGLAARAGWPGAARAVGRAMATNRVMWVIPCHRVLGSGGRLHGYGGPGGLEMKRWLLDHEGASYAERDKQ